jgi:hypothetical protein
MLIWKLLAEVFEIATTAVSDVSGRMLTFKLPDAIKVFANATNANNIANFEIVFIFLCFNYIANIHVVQQTCCKTYVNDALSFC